MLTKIARCLEYYKLLVQDKLGVAKQVVYDDKQADLIPRVSIITSLYKADQFIEAFMCDIVRQTIFDRCELIIINANSPGNEETVIAPYLKKYANIVYVRLGKDPGLYGVWNLGIKMAQALYIANANVDDALAHNCYEVLAKELDDSPEVDIVYAGAYYTKIPNQTFANHNAQRILQAKDFSWHNLQEECLPQNHPMWRVALHQKYGLFDPWFKYAGDYEMWLRAAQAGAQLKKIDKILGLFYGNQQGLSWTVNPQMLAERKRLTELYGAKF